MQLFLPIFPEKTRMINFQLGFQRIDDFVHYLVNGLPIYSHAVDDKNGYRYIMAALVNNKLCSITELSEALGVSRKNIERYAKALRDKGIEHFFNRKETRGQCHKFTPEKMREAQQLLNQGYSQQGTAKAIGVSESAIRYHLKAGSLKKSKYFTCTICLHFPSPRVTKPAVITTNYKISTVLVA